MARCVKCGRKGLFLKVDNDGLCEKCQALNKIQPPTLTFSYSFSVKENIVHQKTHGPLQPTSADAWGGYISPSGGFVNFALFQVRGVNAATKRKRTKKYEAKDEAQAIVKAEKDGLIPPFEVEILPSREPTERQLSYAADLGVIIPPDACLYDVSALINRVYHDDEEPADENIVKWADLYGLHFSRYEGKKALLERASNTLSRSDYKDFMAAIK